MTRRTVLRFVLVPVAVVGMLGLWFAMKAHHVPSTMQDAPAMAVVLEPMVDGFDQPTFAVAAADGSRRLYVVERTGLVRLVAADGTVADAPVVDLRERVLADEGERGLFSLAFHPGFDGPPGSVGRGRAFVNFTAVPDGRLVLAELAITDDGTAVQGPPRILLEIEEPAPTHNGGQVVFGPDGMLHLGVGDGFYPAQQDLQALRLDSLLGKILRIDVDGPPASGLPYAIPPDNPFVDRAEARGEIWAIGLRNPWRMAFDDDGRLWVGDVGGESHEEVTIVQRGGNHGWPIYEGPNFKVQATPRHFYQGRGLEYLGMFVHQATSRANDRVGPVHVYAHEPEVGAAVTGGVFVPETAGLGELTGHYLFADVIQGLVWSLDPAPDGAVVRPLLERAGPVVAFALGVDGEVLVVSLTGTVFRMVPA